MTDQRIVELYWQRDESAIRETDAVYGPRLLALAQRILADLGESEETVNDTYLRTWDTVPPHRPSRLGAFLSKITRELSIDRYRRRTADKRLPGQYALSLEELGECIPGGEQPDDCLDEAALAECISAFLARQTPAVRDTFVRRYFFADSLQEIADRRGEALSRVKSRLYRAREELREHLEKEGYRI